MSDQSYIGAISGWAPNFAPRNWAFCQGQLLPINQNQALFAVIGTTYGGNGQNNFALPNLQGRVPMGAGQSPGTTLHPLGQQAGQETMTLTQLQMPAHNHAATVSASASLPTSSAAATTATPTASTVLASASGAYGRESVDVKIYAPAPGSVSLPLSTTATVAVGATGGNQPFSILQPFTVINYIICQQGIFPPRD
ncbi:phage tail protein [Ectopseudomonas composti]|jgi:microcystin-dependent protein|uniref:phage tail protein n=1 Tax=Ectopseudomonas composti TaxID=658457 RepID=UPI000774DB29|nr:tail fiber protein [Pseudomonas composti]